MLIDKLVYFNLRERTHEDPRRKALIMSIHATRAIDHLKKVLLQLGTRVEETLRRAVESLERRDYELAMQVIDSDRAIDEMEVDVEEECLKLLALFQPVAADLRFIVAVLKINNDLERVGDLAVNIAERSAYLAKQKPVTIPFDFKAMTEKAQWMLKVALDALVNGDPERAWTVIAADDAVDAMNREMYTLVQEGIRKNPDSMNSFLHMLSISRHLERVADQATNIAEDVIYMVEGEIVRHRVEQYLPERPAGMIATSRNDH
jgi:phosphate transport system protein